MKACPFNPAVLRGEGGRDGGVSIWLPDFALYGQGATYAQAKADLLDEVSAYVEEYLAQGYEHAPNRAAHLQHIIKAELAECRGELEQTIFAGPPR